MPFSNDTNDMSFSLHIDTINVSYSCCRAVESNRNARNASIVQCAYIGDGAFLISITGPSNNVLCIFYLMHHTIDSIRW